MMSGSSTYRQTARSRTVSETSGASYPGSQSSSQSVIARQLHDLATSSDSQSDTSSSTEKSVKKKNKKRRKNEYFFSSLDQKKHMAIKFKKKKLLYRMLISTKLKDNRIPVVLLTRLKDDRSLSLPKNKKEKEEVEVEKAPAKINPKISKHDRVVKPYKTQSTRVSIERRQSRRLSQCEDSQSDLKDDEACSSPKESGQEDRRVEEDRMALDRVHDNSVKQSDRRIVSDNSAESGSEVSKRSTSVKTCRTSVNNSDQILAVSSDDCKKSVSLYNNTNVVVPSVQKTSEVCSGNAVKIGVQTKKEAVEQSGELFRESIKSSFSKPASVSKRATRISLHKAEEVSSNDDLSKELVNKTIAEEHEEDLKNLNERFRNSKKSIESKKLSYDDQTDSKSNDKILRNTSKSLENLFISSLINVENVSLNKLAQKIDPKIFRRKPIVRIDKSVIDSISEVNRSFDREVKSSENLSVTVNKNHSKITDKSEISDFQNLNSEKQVILCQSDTKDSESQKATVKTFGDHKLEDTSSKIEAVESASTQTIETIVPPKNTESDEAVEKSSSIKTVKRMRSRSRCKKTLQSEANVESYHEKIVETRSKSPLKKAAELVDLIVKDDMHTKKTVASRSRSPFKKVIESEENLKKVHDGNVNELKESAQEISSFLKKSTRSRSRSKKVVKSADDLKKVDDENVVELKESVQEISSCLKKSTRSKSCSKRVVESEDDLKKVHNESVVELKESVQETPSFPTKSTRSRSCSKKVVESEDDSNKVGDASIVELKESVQKIASLPKKSTRSRSCSKKVVESEDDLRKVHHESVVGLGESVQEISSLPKKSTRSRSPVKKIVEEPALEKTDLLPEEEENASLELRINFLSKALRTRSKSPMKRANLKNIADITSFHEKVVEHKKPEVVSKNSITTRSKSPHKKIIESENSEKIHSRKNSIEPIDIIEEKIDSLPKRLVIARNKSVLKKAVETVESIEAKVEVIPERAVEKKTKSRKKTVDIGEEIESAEKKTIELKAKTVIPTEKEVILRNICPLQEIIETTKTVESSLRERDEVRTKAESPHTSITTRSKTPLKKAVDTSENIVAPQKEAIELEEETKLHPKESGMKLSLNETVDIIENVDTSNKDIIASTENDELHMTNSVALKNKLPGKQIVKAKGVVKNKLSAVRINRIRNKSPSKKLAAIKNNMETVESSSETVIETRNRSLSKKADEAKENVVEIESPSKAVNESRNGSSIKKMDKAEPASDEGESPFKKLLGTRSHFSIKKSVESTPNVLETECCSEKALETKQLVDIENRQGSDQPSPQKTIVIRRRSNRRSSSSKNEDVSTESRDESSKKLSDEKDAVVYTSDRTNIVSREDDLATESKSKEDLTAKCENIAAKKLNKNIDLPCDSVNNQKSEKSGDQNSEVVLKDFEGHLENITPQRINESNAVLSEKVSNKERIIELHSETGNKDLDNSSDSHKENRPCRRSTRLSSQNNEDISGEIMNGVCFNSVENLIEDIHNDSQILEEECTDNCLDKSLESNVIFNPSDISHELTENDLKSVENLVIDSIINGDIVSPKIIMQSSVPKTEDIQTFDFGHTDLSTVVDFDNEIASSKISIVNPTKDPNLGEQQENQSSLDNLEDCGRKAALQELKKKCTDNLHKKRQAEFDRITAEILGDESLPPTVPPKMDNEKAPLETKQTSTEPLSANSTESADSVSEAAIPSDEESDLNLAERIAQFKSSEGENTSAETAEIPASVGKKFSCMQCGEIFNSNRDLKKHVKDLHRQRLLMKIIKTRGNKHVTSMLDEPAEDSGFPGLLPIIGQETLLPDTLDVKDQTTDGEIKMIVAKESGTRNSHIVKELKITPKTPESSNSTRIPGYSPASSEISSGNSSCRVPNYSPAKPELSGSTGFMLPAWSPARSEQNQNQNQIQTQPPKKKPGRPRKYPIFTETELIAKRIASLRHNNAMGGGKDLDFIPVESILEPGLLPPEPISLPITVSPKVKAGLIAKLHHKTENSVQEKTPDEDQAPTETRRRRRRRMRSEIRREEEEKKASKILKDDSISASVKRRRSQSQESSVDVPLPDITQESKDLPETKIEPVELIAVQTEKKPKIISDVVVPGEKKINISIVRRSRRRSVSQDSSIDVPLPATQEEEEDKLFAPVVSQDLKSAFQSLVDDAVSEERDEYVATEETSSPGSEEMIQNSATIDMPLLTFDDLNQSETEDYHYPLVQKEEEADHHHHPLAQEGEQAEVNDHPLDQEAEGKAEMDHHQLLDQEGEGEANVDHPPLEQKENESHILPEFAEPANERLKESIRSRTTSQGSDISVPVFQEVKNSEMSVAAFCPQSEDDAKVERRITRGRSRTLSQSSFLDVPSHFFERKSEFDVCEYFVENDEMPIESIVEDMVLQHDEKVHVRRGGRRRCYSQDSCVDVPMLDDFEKEINVNFVTKERKRSLSLSSTTEIPMFEDVEKEIEINVVRREQIRPMSRESNADSYAEDLEEDEYDSRLNDSTGSQDSLSRYHITKELVVQLTKIDTVPTVSKDGQTTEDDETSPTNSIDPRPKRTPKPNSAFNEFETIQPRKRPESNNNDAVDKWLVDHKPQQQQQLNDETLEAASTSKETTSECLGIPELQMEGNQITVSENQLVATPRREVINKMELDESQNAKLNMIMNAATPNETMETAVVQNKTMTQDPVIPNNVIQKNVMIPNNNVQNTVVQQPLSQQQQLMVQPFVQQQIAQQQMVQQRIIPHQIIQQQQVVQQVIQPQQFCILFIPDQLSYSSESSARDATPTATIVNFQPVPDAEMANKPLIFTPTAPSTPSKIMSVEDPTTKTLICGNCAQVLELMGRLEAMVGMMEEDKSLIKCPFCSNHFQSLFYLEYHMRQEHLKCENEKQCRHSSVNSLRIPTHETTSDSESYITFALKCRSCYDIFNTVQQLNDHVMQKHKTLVRFKPVPTSSLSPSGAYQPQLPMPPKNGTRMPVVQCPSDCVCRIGIRSTDTPQQRQQMLKRCPYAMRRLEKIESAAYEVYTCTLCKSTFLMKDEVVDHLMKMHEVACKFPCYTCLVSFRTLQLQEKHQCSDSTLKDIDKLLNIAILPTNVGEKNNGDKFLQDSPTNADELRAVKPTTESPGTPKAAAPPPPPTRNGLKRKNGEVLANLNRFLGPSEPKKFKFIGRHRKRPCPKCEKKFAYRKHLFNHILIEHIANDEKNDKPKKLVEELFALVGSGMLSGQRIDELAEKLSKYKDKDGVSYRTITMIDDTDYWRSGYEEVSEHEMVLCIKCKEYFKFTDKLPRSASEYQGPKEDFDRLCDTCDTRTSCGPKTRRRAVITNGYLRQNSETNGILDMRYSCKDCSDSYSSLIELKSHKRMAHGKTYQDKTHECDNCKKCFISSRMLEKHKKHFPKCQPAPLPPQPPPPPVEQEVAQPEINNQTVDSSESSSVMETSESADSSNRRDSSDSANSQDQQLCQLSCSFCDIMCASEVSLKNHLKRTHGRRVSICQFCNGLLINTNEVRHMLEHHIVPNKSSRCRRNGYLQEEACTIEDIDELIRALGKHRLQSLMVYHDFEGKCNNAIMHCPSCPEMFASRESCRFHYVWTHDNTCLLCDEVFRSASIACQHKLKAHTSAASYLWCIQRLVTAIVNTLKLDPGQPSLVICQELISRLEEQEEEERLLMEAQVVATETAVVVAGGGGEDATGGERFLEVLSEDQLPDSGNMIEVVIGKEDSEDDLLSLLNLSPSNYESSCAGEQSLPNPESAPPEQVEAEEVVLPPPAEPPALAPLTPAPPPAPSPAPTENYFSSGVCKINLDTGEEQMMLVVTDEDLITYKDNIMGLAEKISATCDSFTFDEITEMLRAYFENVNNAAA